MHKERVMSMSWAGTSSLHCICLEVKKYKNQGWDKTGHFCIVSLEERGMPFRMHLTIAITGVKAFIARSLCVKRVSGTAGMPPGGHSLWVTADSRGLAAHCCLSIWTGSLFGVGCFSLDTKAAESSDSFLMVQQLLCSLLPCIMLSLFLSKMVADRKQLLKKHC